MSTPSTLPNFTMLDPEGAPRVIPADQLGNAMAGGLKMASKMIDPEGTARWIPYDMHTEALKAGMQPYGAMQPRRPIDAQPSVGTRIDNALTTIGNDFNSFLKPTGFAPGGYPNIQYNPPSALREHMFTPDADQSKEQAFQQGIRDDERRKAAGYGPAYRAIAPFAQAIGTNVNGMEGAAARGDQEGVSAHIVAPLTMGISAAESARGVGPQVDAGAVVRELANGELPQHRAVPSSAITPESINKLMLATDPDLSGAPNFFQDFGKHLPDVLSRTYAKGGRIGSPADLAKAFQESAAENRQVWKEQIIAPVQDVDMPAPPGYGGRLSDMNNHRTTIADMDARLTEINAMLDPAYRRGGQGTQQSAAAVAAKSEGELNAEAAAIRQQLYSELGKRYGVPPETMAAARARIGAQRAIGDNLQASVNDVLMKQATQANKPPMKYSINPFDKGKSFVFDLITDPIMEGAQRGIQRVRGGNFANRTVRDILSNVSPEDLPSFQVQDTSTPNTRVPLWQGIEPGRPEPFYSTEPSTPRSKRASTELAKYLKSRKETPEGF